jgi:hypothetical protein
LFDINGTSIWNIIISESFISNNVLLKYKEIDSATDMIIATSGENNFNYNMIISYSNPPY